MKKLIHQNSDAGISQYFHSDDEGNISLETVQDVSPIIENNRAQFNAVDERAKWGEGQKVASIPMSLFHKLKREGILDDQAAFRRWLNDPENRFFRTRPGTV